MAPSMHIQGSHDISSGFPSQVLSVYAYDFIEWSFMSEKTNYADALLLPWGSTNQ